MLVHRAFSANDSGHSMQRKKKLQADRETRQMKSIEKEGSVRKNSAAANTRFRTCQEDIIAFM